MLSVTSLVVVVVVTLLFLRLQSDAHPQPSEILHVQLFSCRT